ncbi:MAG: DUF3990 domain-containing protein, partial [Deltaproteobacteria bacterium]|nr:DUF3990 domain-containing protein [Deltaproteobacteria bacterium]
KAFAWKRRYVKMEGAVINIDVVIGGVANDKVFNTIELFFDKLNLQYCFRSQSTIDEYLTFIASETL